MNTPSEKPSFLNRHPWIYVALAFLLLIGAWSTLITLAVKNSPERIEILPRK
jgi:hypothetical protein